jgi:hypothetical protein
VHGVGVDDARFARLAREYRRFSAQDTPERSALYTELTLRAAIAVARADPPRVAGDLRHDLAALAAEAPADATLVAFHTAVLGYVRDPADRRRFAETVRSVGARWVANESPGIVDLEQPPPVGTAPAGSAWTPSRSPGPTPHGAWLKWLGR